MWLVCSLVLAWNCTISWSLVHFVMQCTQVSQFLWLGCVLYVTALEAYWCTEASAALLLSFIKKIFFNMFVKFLVQYGVLIEVELEGRSSLP